MQRITTDKNLTIGDKIHSLQRALVLLGLLLILSVALNFILFAQYD
jgi:hypothetical protein